MNLKTRKVYLSTREYSEESYTCKPEHRHILIRVLYGVLQFVLNDAHGRYQISVESGLNLPEAFTYKVHSLILNSYKFIIAY